MLRFAWRNNRSKLIIIFLFHLLLSGFIGVGFGLSPAQAADATLFLTPATGSHTTGQVFTLALKLDTGGGSDNAVSADLSFPVAQLQVESLSTTGSSITIWTKSPTYSNTNGTINLEGGTPNPGINSASAQIVDITFKAKAAGTATVSIDASSRVLANDGSGTDVLSQRKNAVVTLVAPPPEAPATPTPTPSESPSPSPSPEASPSPEPSLTPTPEALPTPQPPIATQIITQIGEITKKITQVATQVANTPGVAVSVGVAAAIAAADNVVSLGGSTLGAATAWAQTTLPNNWLSFFSWFTWRKKRRGKVVSSATDRPVPGAIVSLYNSLVYNRMVEQQTTDRNGSFGFLVGAGEYILTVAAQGFKFPSSQHQEYHGEKVTTPKEQVLAPIIYVDPESVSATHTTWVERLKIMWYVLHYILLVCGTVFSFLVFQHNHGLTWLYLVGYTVLWLVTLWGKEVTYTLLLVRDATGHPLPLAIVRMRDGLGKLKLAKVTTEEGQVLLLVPEGKYTLEVTPLSGSALPSYSRAVSLRRSLFMHKLTVVLQSPSATSQTTPPPAEPLLSTDI